MSAQAGWYPDPGGGQGLFRYWDGKSWSAATSPYPTAAPPSQGITGGAGPATSPTGPTGSSGASGFGTGTGGGQPLGSTPPSFGRGGQPLGSTPPSFGGGGGAYANYQATEKKRSPVGWWIAGAALVLVIVVVAVIAIRAATSGGGGGTVPGVPGGQSSQDVCPVQQDVTPSPQPNDGRVHGGPLSYPILGSPWSAVEPETRLPFGTDVWKQQVMDQENYEGDNDWVASILVGELQAGDGFFTPEQGSQIVVKCIMGTFYGEGTQVTGDVKRNEAANIDGHEAWIVESALSFDIPQLTAKGERLIVAIVATGSRSGLYYASIPDTRPELVEPAREALKALTVDG